MQAAPRIFLPLLCLATALALTHRVADGQPADTPQKSGSIQIGNPPFVSSATALNGSLEQQYPFDPESYGKVSGFSPTSSQDPKIVLYTLSLDKDFFRLAAVIDAFVTKHKSLNGSLVVVIDAKGAQVGGYSVEEVLKRSCSGSPRWTQPS
ncbi:MAG TPA: hypothetical protein VKU00_33610 [Chthonomonadaceae bacterium]|nr:hypothetical protein [Chthonomonadaceae bacterium]